MGQKGIFFICFFSAILLVNFHRTYANKRIDSLEVKLILVEEREKVHILNQLSTLYRRTQPRKTNKKALEAYKLSSRFQQESEKATALRNLGLTYSQLISDYDTALYLCSMAFDIERQASLPRGQASTLVAMADIYRDAGDHIKAVSQLLEALRISDSLQYLDLSVDSRLKLAEVYSALDDNNSTIETLRSGLKMAKLADDRVLEGRCLLAFGKFYLDEGNYLLAYDNLLLAWEKIAQSDDTMLKSEILYRLGECNRLLDKFEAGHEQFTRALKIRRDDKDTRGLAEIYVKLGALEKDRGNYRSSEKWLMKGLNLAEMINSNHLMRACYDLLFYVSAELGDYQAASYYSTRFASITEQIYTEASERKFAELEAQHQIQRKQQELTLLSKEFESQRLELQKRRIFNIALVIILVLLLTIGVIVYYYYRENKRIADMLQKTNATVSKQNKELKDLNITKDKFFSIIGHDLKSPVNSLTAFSELLTKGTSKMSEAELKTIASHLNRSLKTLQVLLDNLLTWARTQTGTIEMKPTRFDLDEVIRETLELLAQTAGNKEIGLSYKSRAGMNVLADVDAIKTVLRNLVSNAIKFTKRSGKISILIDEYKDAFEVGIKDTGVGMTMTQVEHIFDMSTKKTTSGTEQEKGTGLGLMLCKEFVEKNGGRIYVESKQYEGSTFRFTVPKVQTNQASSDKGAPG